ncbi:Superfamily I DNA and RNA helicase and helicase subunits-like protein [Natrinema altunense JCM 12890]|uniref:Superfamily I DNA and RNA helicase and helicase subunits-like protein n=1 Tax=Natrinema altunense (strain JCM 12890 / CGMCC 1.3731 / AJ2) TaxID=1227494 RepID=L9ZMH8_NATA2|nr:Superfamily I DNA and RNA helicase and helicase subunits-like protein [Natrinema altunense JCM 12890]
MRRADVVASTNSSASEIPNSQTFDYVIIDEATQASIPSSLIPTVYGQTTILVGDHKQLPPFSHQNAIQKSLFERLYAEDGIYGPRIGIRFNTQYRMHERIAGFSSEEFYDEGLKTASEAGKVSKNIDVYPVGIFDVSGHNEIGNKPKKNPAEIECVKMQLKMLIENKGIRGSDIGVAAAYKKQANEIESHLQQSEIQDVSSVKVNTFDSFQGSERDAMILSFTRSNENGNIGFLGDEIGKRRLNVALTRAKRYCALIGDWETLRDGSELYDRLYQYVTSEVPPKKVKT